MDHVNDMEDLDNGSRLDNEILLLEAMYPEQVEWKPQAREIRFWPFQSLSAHDTQESSNVPRSVLVLRLPDNYLSGGDTDSSWPIVISATNSAKQDLRNAVTTRWQSLNLERGQEVLDQILTDFQSLVDDQDRAAVPDLDNRSYAIALDVDLSESCKTVIIWLHHLLATGKRKLALNPTLYSSKSSSLPSSSCNSNQISGLTKPGYPGIMVFTGPVDLVDAHLMELKNQRWQAFQVRLETLHDHNDLWTFEHGSGIHEVESMSEMVSNIHGDDNKNTFLKVVGVK